MCSWRSSASASPRSVITGWRRTTRRASARGGSVDPGQHSARISRALHAPDPVTELARGQSFDTFRAQTTQTERDRAGMLLYPFTFESIFHDGLFNADPHPGNYLFDAGNVTFLDFGCVKRFPPELVARWKTQMRATLEGHIERAAQAWVAMGMVPDPSRYHFGYHQRMMLTLYEPWLADELFRFTPAFVERTWRALMLENPNESHTNIPKDLVFVSRRSGACTPCWQSWARRDTSGAPSSICCMLPESRGPRRWLPSTQLPEPIRPAPQLDAGATLRQCNAYCVGFEGSTPCSLAFSA